jgi:TolA-binding protein
MRNIIIISFLMIFIGLSADFNFARELFEDGLYEEAINEFEKIVQLYPTSYEAERSIFYIAESYKEQEKFDLARSTYLQILEGYPQSTFKDQVYYSLASVQYFQTDYTNAIANFEYLINNYPLSEFTKQSLVLYLKCFYQLEQFNLVIEKGDQLQKDYDNSKEMPEILLVMIKAYLKLNSRQEAETLLQRIHNEFGTKNARWEAIMIESNLLVQDNRLAEAETKLINSINDGIPRNYEEEFRLELAEIYLKDNKFQEAVLELQILIEKFNHSDRLDKFIFLLSKAQLGSGEYQTVTVELSNPKVIENSEFYDDYLLNKAEAYFYLKQLNEASNLTATIIDKTDSEVINYKTEYLIARINEESGRWVEAVKIYSELTNSEFAVNDALWMRIGNIYLEDLSNFNKAIKYYNNVILGTFSPQIQYQALYLKAVCYEKLEKYNEAVDAIRGIDLDEIADMDFSDRISRKLDYLKKFKQQHYDSAFTGLLTAIYDFLETGSEDDLQYELVDILSTDLKKYQLSNEMLSDPNDQRKNYLKALINLKLAEKFLIQNEFNQADNYFDEALRLAAGLDVENFKEEVREISLREQILRAEDRDGLVDNLESFINEYQESPARDEFLITIIDHYRQKKDEQKMIRFVQLLSKNDRIDMQEYYKNKLWLAEYYYQKDMDEAASENYQLASPYIDLNHPDALFHFAVTLDQTGEQDKAAAKLEFLINNSIRFRNYDTVVDYFVDLLISKGNLNKAAEYYFYIPEENRDDSFYLKLSEIYLAMDDKHKAKEAIMHIVEKDNATLEQLAFLQYETADLEMAKYSFTLLKNRDKSNMTFFEMLGRIAFEQEKYLECAENYKVLIDDWGESPPSEVPVSRIARENIISLYRISNRPKAETLTKKFKQHLNKQDNDQIQLNEGIYYLQIDEKNAEKSFNKLIKLENVSNRTRYQAYFWRGVSRIKLEKIDEAEADFLIVLESSEQELINQANMKLGTLNFSRENYQQALQHYYDVIENDETGKLALDAARNFAYVCKTIEEWQKAVAAYEIILERWGDSELEGNTLFDIAFCHFRDKRYPDAVEMFLAALQQLNDRELSAEAQYWIGEAWFNMADYDKAIAEFLKVSYNYSDYVQWAATAELKAGEAYSKAGEKDKAIRIYERVIDKYGEISQWGKEAQLRISSLKSGN